jgi:hypothetical protein
MSYHLTPSATNLRAGFVLIAIPSPFAIDHRIRLLLPRTGVMDVLTAVIIAAGEHEMTTLTAENQETTQATAPTSEPKATTKANVAPRKPHVAPPKATSGKKTTPAKKGAKAPKKAKSAKAKGAREGSKTEKVLDLLKRAGGASLKEIMKTTEWQPHSVRGFLSGTISKKMGLKVESTKTESGERIYSVQ